jgi:hypothetical protein
MTIVLLVFAYIYSGADGGAHVAVTQIPMRTMQACEDAAKKVRQGATPASSNGLLNFGNHFRDAVCVVQE